MNNTATILYKSPIKERLVIKNLLDGLKIALVFSPMIIVFEILGLEPTEILKVVYLTLGCVLGYMLLLLLFALSEMHDIVIEEQQICTNYAIYKWKNKLIKIKNIKSIEFLPQYVGRGCHEFIIYPIKGEIIKIEAHLANVYIPLLRKLNDKGLEFYIRKEIKHERFENDLKVLLIELKRAGIRFNDSHAFVRNLFRPEIRLQKKSD